MTQDIIAALADEFERRGDACTQSVPGTCKNTKLRLVTRAVVWTEAAAMLRDAIKQEAGS